jgi:hypothetical protein
MITMSKYRLLALPGALFLGLALPAAASAAVVPAAHEYHSGSCTGRGQYATCVAGGNENRPLKIYVNARSHPDQRITVYWSDVCGKGLGAGTRSGHFSAATPIHNHRIPHPYAEPDNCSVSADGQINKGNYIHIDITYTRW